MEKITYDLKKIFLVDILIYLIYFIYSIAITSKSFVYETKSTLTMLVIMLILTWYVFHFENVDSNRGIFFSNDGILIIKNGKKFNCPWDSVKVKIKYNLFNLVKIIIISSENLDKNYNLIFFPASKKSILKLIKLYVPAGHDLKKVLE